MDIDTSAAAGGDETNLAGAIPASPASLREAGRELARARGRNDAEPAEDGAGAPSGEGPPQDDAAFAGPAGPDEAPSADPEAVAPPPSWTEEDRTAFAALPREAQARLRALEGAREAELLRHRHAAADLIRAAEAERGQLAQARQHYETALPALLATLQAQDAGEFGDIRSMADVERMAREDFARYARWDAQQKKLAAIAQEVETVRQRQVQEQDERWQHFARREDDLIREQVPELADPEQGRRLRESAVSVLRERGFTDTELDALYHGQAGVSLRDHRVQLLILDALRWQDARAKAKRAAAAPVPPVQRPGVAGSGNAADAEIASLRERLDRSGSLRDAAALRAAQLKAARRG